MAGGLALVALAWSGRQAMPIADAQSADDVPVFEVDAAWPKPLPNKWAVGPVSGIATDTRDHIWIIHRGETVKQAGGVPAPPVIEFDPAGNVVQTWGGPGSGYEWPQQVHGITVDAKDRVWISGNGERDTHILAFSRAGKFLLQIGRPGKRRQQRHGESSSRATQMRVDPRSNEIFVSDGETEPEPPGDCVRLRDGRVQAALGRIRREAGRFRRDRETDPAGPPPRQFGNAVHCVRIDRDGLVYVCDRSNSRFQIFRKDGSFSEGDLRRGGRQRGGTVADIDFSPDQKFLYVADGGNQKVWILRRDQLPRRRVVRRARPRRRQFATTLHDLTVDSKETCTRARRQPEAACRSLHAF